MKKLLRIVLISVMFTSILMLGGCKKAQDVESTQTVESAVSDENVKEEEEADKKAESSEKTKDDKTKSGDDKDIDEKATADSESDKDVEPASLTDIYNEIAKSVTLPEMYFADEDFMLNYYGIDAAKLEDYVFASCLDSTSADSIILIRLKDESSADEIVESLNMVLEEMSIEFESYNPEAAELAKDAEVRVSGKNIDLIIHKDRNKILSIIDSLL